MNSLPAAARFVSLARFCNGSGQALPFFRGCFQSKPRFLLWRVPPAGKGRSPFLLRRRPPAAQAPGYERPSNRICLHPRRHPQLCPARMLLREARPLKGGGGGLTWARQSNPPAKPEAYVSPIRVYCQQASQDTRKFISPASPAPRPVNRRIPILTEAFRRR